MGGKLRRQQEHFFYISCCLIFIRIQSSNDRVLKIMLNSRIKAQNFFNILIFKQEFSISHGMKFEPRIGDKEINGVRMKRYQIADYQ
ncbi:CLUMA_CG014759, isoform A [Clunio marinus]|uniref:CLUMA_CG014759, isoform A n=1 Tax=Clunio marinus TaxID=568069 RepID=A0A1J1ILS4_9DIPT|nr:CLUMA_CG014759, isoform A [Clunio marinus]